MDVVEVDYREVTSLEDYSTDRLAAEANNLYHQAEGLANASLMMLAEAGKRLIIIKEREGHGNWEKWMDMNLSFSKAKAKRMMKLAEKMDGEIGVFANRSTLSDIGISKVWALLEAPEDVQKEVMENPEMEDASVREFKEEIKRLKQEKEEQEEKHRTDNENYQKWINELEEEKARIEKRLEEAQEHSTEKLEEELAKMSETAVRNQEAAMKEAQKVEKLLKEKARIEKALEEAKEDLKKQPETIIDEQAIERAVEEARKEAERELQEFKQRSAAHTQTLEDENRNLTVALERSKKESDSTLLLFQEKFNAFHADIAGIITFVENDTDEERKQNMKEALKKALQKIEAQI